MLKLWSKETLPGELPLLGLIKPQKGERHVCLMQRITVPGAGSFLKKQPVELMNDVGLCSYLTQGEEQPQAKQYHGVLLSQEMPDPLGQVCFQHGCYEYHLPVYPPSQISDRWAVRGYLPVADGGYVSVAGKRHIAAKVIAIPLLVVLLGAAYAVYTYGWEAVQSAVVTWFASLAEQFT